MPKRPRTARLPNTITCPSGFWREALAHGVAEAAANQSTWNPTSRAKRWTIRSQDNRERRPEPMLHAAAELPKEHAAKMLNPVPHNA